VVQVSLSTWRGDIIQLKIDPSLRLNEDNSNVKRGMATNIPKDLEENQLNFSLAYDQHFCSKDHHILVEKKDERKKGPEYKRYIRELKAKHHKKTFW
jgi:hypothetical protein